MSLNALEMGTKWAQCPAVTCRRESSESAMKGEVFLWLVTDSKTGGFSRPDPTSAEAMVVVIFSMLVGGCSLTRFAGSRRRVTLST
jgi:hypothetical protein